MGGPVAVWRGLALPAAGPTLPVGSPPCACRWQLTPLFLSCKPEGGLLAAWLRQVPQPDREALYQGHTVTGPVRPPAPAAPQELDKQLRPNTAKRHVFEVLRAVGPEALSVAGIFEKAKALGVHEFDPEKQTKSVAQVGAAELAMCHACMLTAAGRWVEMAAGDCQRLLSAGSIVGTRLFLPGQRTFRPSPPASPRPPHGAAAVC